MDKIRNNKFATTISVIVAAVFIANLVLSRGFNLLMISLTGGGRLVDFLAASRSDLINIPQCYRLITYGYLHPTIWHLAINICALWYVGLFIEKELSKKLIFFIYHVGLIVPVIVFSLIFPDGYMYGASPAIFCFLGIMVMWLIKDRTIFSEYKSLRGSRYLLCYMILSNFLSLGTFVVHLAGFCTGLFIGIIVKPGYLRKKKAVSSIVR